MILVDFQGHALTAFAGLLKCDFS